jgi:hypothetical protein
LLQDQQQVPEQVLHQPEQVLRMVFQYHQLEQVLLQLEQALRMVFQYHQSEQVLLQLEQVQCQE